MARVEKTVFISYRRADSFAALLVFKDLTQHGYDVFIDYDGLASGDFERSIIDNIGSRAHFVVLLTPTALDRCDDQADWMRREIEHAIATKRNLVPVLLSGFSFYAPSVLKRLDGGLASLSRYNAVVVPDTFFDEAMGRLRSRFLAVAVDLVLHPSSEHARQVAHQQQEAARAAVPELLSKVYADALSAAPIASVRQATGAYDVIQGPQPQRRWWLRAATIGAVVALVIAMGIGRVAPVPAAHPKPASSAESGITNGSKDLGPAELATLGDDAFYGTNGVKQSDAEAAKWYSLAAERDDPAGQAGLGLLLESGRGGLSQDDVAAVRLYHHAAGKGNQRAQHNLAFMYERGRGGLEKSDSQALAWYRKAAAQGHAPAQYNLGLLYQEGRGGVAKDDKQAVAWYSRAAEQGVSEAQSRLAFAYVEGLGGLAKSDENAAAWYRKAANLGLAEAEYAIGWMSEMGRGGLAKSDVLAVSWYRTAAYHGYAAAQLSLGEMYAAGRGGLSKSDVDAVVWFRKAANQGDADAQEALAAMYERGAGVEQSQAEAARLYRLAAKGGSELARMSLRRLGEK